ncbi:hypothetical protein F5884DRAFT_480252 [Xylogone sp. PMI_703]|nr:hypothetical protein F5884DRAFT_480252 [Xylogone sp. PMI_703]
MVSRRPRRSAGQRLVSVSVTICCLPILCTWGIGLIAIDAFKFAKHYERPKKRAERQEKENARAMWRRNPTDLDMAPRLERSLTLPLRVPEHVDLSGYYDSKEFDKFVKGAVVHSGGKKVKDLSPPPVREPQRTEDQLQSPFFQLPLEIRRQIYEEVLAGHVFHIYFVPAYRRLSHTRCKNRSPVCTGEICRARVKVPEMRDEWGNASLLHMLQTCRKIYSEAIEILYKQNTFDFDSLNGVLQLSRTILPSRMKMVKSVQWR